MGHIHFILIKGAQVYIVNDSNYSDSLLTSLVKTKMRADTNLCRHKSPGLSVLISIHPPWPLLSLNHVTYLNLSGSATLSSWGYRISVNVRTANYRF